MDLQLAEFRQIGRARDRAPPPDWGRRRSARRRDLGRRACALTMSSNTWSRGRAKTAHPRRRSARSAGRRNRGGAPRGACGEIKFQSRLYSTRKIPNLLVNFHRAGKDGPRGAYCGGGPRGSSTRRAGGGPRAGTFTTISHVLARPRSSAHFHAAGPRGGGPRPLPPGPRGGGPRLWESIVPRSPACDSGNFDFLHRSLRWRARRRRAAPAAGPGRRPTWCALAI